MGGMIRSMALAIAQAQWELDKSSMTVTELMSGQRLLRDLDTGKLLDQDGKPTGETTQPIIIDSRVYFGHTYAPLMLALTVPRLMKMRRRNRRRLINDVIGKEVETLMPRIRKAEKRDYGSRKL